MSKINDGGPAFPVQDIGAHGNFGMSLRDWFAGQAIMGIMAAEGVDVIYPLDGAAGRAYRLADAMLAERAKREAGQ